MSVTTTQAVSLLENVLFESPTMAASNANGWATLSATNPTVYGTTAQIAAAMTVTAETSIPEQVFRYYAAALGRTPSGSELSYYVHLAEESLTASQVAQGASGVPQTTWNTIANDFTNSPESASLYGSGASNFVVLLYINILGRVPVASEVAFYNAQLTNGYTSGALMQEFANSSEYQAIANPQIATALANHGVASLSGSASGALPLYGLSADSQASVTEGGTEVFTVKTHGVAAGTTLYYSLSGVTSANVESGQLSGTVTVGSNGDAIIPVALVQTMTNSGGLSGNLTASLSATQGGASLSTASVALTEGTGNHTIITVTGTNDTINIGAASSNYSAIGLGGSSNTANIPGNGAYLTLNLLGGTGTTINGYSPTSGTGLHIVNTTSAAHASLIDASGATPQDGGALYFNNGTAYAVLTGTMGDGSSASVLQAINAAYKVAGTAGEAITFIGQDKAGNTEVWYFGSTAGATHGVIPASSQTGSADLNGNHTIDANEITLVATLTGVKASSLTVADLV